jgi:hypothetical protein
MLQLEPDDNLSLGEGEWQDLRGLSAAMHADPAPFQALEVQLILDIMVL